MITYYYLLLLIIIQAAALIDGPLRQSLTPMQLRLAGRVVENLMREEFGPAEVQSRREIRARYARDTREISLRDLGARAHRSLRALRPYRLPNLAGAHRSLRALRPYRLPNLAGAHRSLRALRLAERGAAPRRVWRVRPRRRGVARRAGEMTRDRPRSAEIDRDRYEIDRGGEGSLDAQER